MPRLHSGSPMNTFSPPFFAVRLIGFTPAQSAIIDDTFRSRDGSGCFCYFHLSKDRLQDPDLFLIEAGQAADPQALRSLGVSPARPALLVGAGKSQPYPARLFQGRLDSPALLLGLDKLVGQRNEVLARLSAADQVSVPERRRRERHGPAGVVPGVERLRRAPAGGGILVVDESAELSDHVSGLLAGRSVPVTRVESEDAAGAHCRNHRVALVIINSATAGVDCYRLCAAIKAIMAARVKVVFLLAPAFPYDATLARRAGCDGFLGIPLTHESVGSLLQRFLPGQRKG